MTEYQSCRANQIKYGLSPRRDYKGAKGYVWAESESQFISRIKRQMAERLIQEILEGEVARARVRGLADKK